MTDSAEFTIDNSLADEINDETHDEVLPSSTARNLVELAAYRIDLQPSKLKHLLQIMEEELITEVWQLHYLDSANWKDMGFPIGLVASIRRLLHEKDIAECTDKNEFAIKPTFDGMPSYSISIKSSNNKRDPSRTDSIDETDDELSAATEPETPMLSSGVPPKESNTTGGGSSTKRISDITLSERLCNRIFSTGMLLSPHHVSKQITGNSGGISQIFHRASAKDQPPVSASRRSWKTACHSPTRSPTRSSRSGSSLNQRSQKQQQQQANSNNCLRTSMPPRPSRRPTLHDTQNMTKLDFDDLSDTAESFAMDNVGMFIVESNEERKKKVDNNSSMDVVTGSLKDLTKYLSEGADSTIDEVAESESKRSDGSDDIHDPSMSTGSPSLPFNARLLSNKG